MRSGALLPDFRQFDERLDTLLHVLTADPFERRVKSVAAGKDVGTRQAHERQQRTIGAAADAAAHWHHPGAPNGLNGIFDDLRMTVEDGLHVAILLLDLEGEG